MGFVPLSFSLVKAEIELLESTHPNLATIDGHEPIRRRWGGIVKTFLLRGEINRMSTDVASNTNAVFTSDRFDRVWHPDGGDSHPPPGCDFALSLVDAFIAAGFDVTQMDRDSTDANNLWWEHSYWYFFLIADRQKYFVQLEPIDNGDLWRVAFSRSGGIGSIFRSHQQALRMPMELQQRADAIIQSLAACDDLRWVTEDEAVSLW